MADRCTLEGRFLQVTGEPHTYRIHILLGSGDMSPTTDTCCQVGSLPTPATLTNRSTSHNTWERTSGGISVRGTGSTRSRRSGQATWCTHRSSRGRGSAGR
ncbi:hypothetical protein [Streptomyces sp. CA-210063]|uniref:hypothetical protein n=1 Tax=Streptomyces sp. CA-210063 TaxID=2801029 RepID=UPI003FA78252